MTTLLPVPSSRSVTRAVLLYVLLAAAAVLLVDVVLGGVGGVSDKGTPVWFLLFEEGSPTEWLQAALLLLWVLYAGAGAALAADRQDRDRTTLLLLLGVSATLLLLDDTCNVGQWLGARVEDVVGGGDGISAGDVARLPVFAVAGALPTYCLWRYRSLLREHAAARRLLLSGYGLYALMAVVSQGLTLVTPVYPTVGDAVLDGVFRGRLLPAGGPSEAFFADPGTVFMDYVFEESLELAAATLLALGVLALVRDLARTERRPADAVR